MLNEQTIVLNLVPGEVPPVAYVTQDDVGREIRLVFMDDNTRFNLSSSYTYSLRGTKPSGTGFAYDDAVTAVDLNSVSFKTNSVMTAVAGPVRCGIIIYDGDEHVETLNFIMHVQKTALEPSTIIDSDDFESIIAEAISSWVEDSEDAAEIIEQAVSDWMDEHGSGGGGSSVSPYTSNPAALGMASPGVSDDYSRGDHIHPKPSASDIGAIATDQGSDNAGKFLVVGNDGVVVPVAMTTWMGGSY